MAESINTPLIYEHDLSGYSVLSLAYMGDAVIESFAREYVIAASKETRPGKLVAQSKNFITCEAQSDALENILSELTETEQAVYKRGRNTKTHFVPKHAELIQYRRATGFEALMGYLYLKGEVSRAKELFIKAYGIKELL